MIVVGIDPGSVRCGVAVTVAGEVAYTATVAVDRAQLGAAARDLLDVIRTSGAARVAVEWTRVYVPGGADAAKASGMAHAHETMAILLDRVEAALESHKVDVVKIHPNTVRTRIGAKRGEDETSDAAVARALETRFGERVKGWSVDQRDAIAVALASSIVPEVKPGQRYDGKRIRKKYPRKPTPRKCGTRYMRSGHPSDAAFDKMLETGNYHIKAPWLKP